MIGSKFSFKVGTFKTSHKLPKSILKTIRMETYFIMCCICTQVEVRIENSLLIVCSIVQLRYFFGLLFILCNSVETVCMQLLAEQGLGHPLQ
jgi:hypothetical protein